jgi:hypothetical protein
MQLFGDETGLLWTDSRASARDFVRGLAHVSQHNPLGVRIDEQVSEYQRLARREEALKVQLAAVAEAKASLLDGLEASIEAAIAYEQTGEVDSRLIPECKDAIQAELASDSRDVLKAADMQEVPELRAVAKEHGWDFDRASADNDFVYVTLKRKRELIANAGPRLTRETLRSNVAKAIAAFRADLADRRRIVADARQMIARVLTPLQPAAP